MQHEQHLAISETAPTPESLEADMREHLRSALTPETPSLWSADELEGLREGAELVTTKIAQTKKTPPPFSAAGRGSENKTPPRH